MLYRLAIKMRQPIIGDWQAKVHEFWDSAIKGSSCLRAALARAFRMEAGVAADFVAIAELWDVGAFYDSIRIHNLVELALDKNSLCKSSTCPLLCILLAEPSGKGLT